MTTLPAACLVCNSTAIAETYTVHELQLGLGDAFQYQRCGHCGSLQLQNPPDDFSKYYPNDSYYSFNINRKAPKRDRLREIKASYLLYNQYTMLGRLLSIGYKKPEFYHWLKQSSVNRGDAILDVGCGNGSLLTNLSLIGFTNLTGIDPFIDAEALIGRVKILKKDLFDLQPSYDLIMMHHSLEHMTNPQQVLQQAHDLLKHDGRLLVRIPIMGHYGWQHYGTMWSGIDAPRHIFIPTVDGFRKLAALANFTIEKLEYDSLDDVIWASEQYKKGISLIDPRSRSRNRGKSIFSKVEIEHFKKTIAKENTNQNGDYAAFYLKKK